MSVETERVHWLRKLLHQTQNASAGHEEDRIDDESDDEDIGELDPIGDEHEDCCDEQCEPCKDE